VLLIPFSLVAVTDAYLQHSKEGCRRTTMSSSPKAMTDEKFEGNGPLDTEAGDYGHHSPLTRRVLLQMDIRCFSSPTTASQFH
jgi:hypothetical protein